MGQAELVVVLSSLSFLPWSTMVCISINGVFLDPRHKAYEWQQLVGEDGPPYPEETERRDKPSRFCNFFSVNLRTSNIWGLNF